MTYTCPSFTIELPAEAIDTSSYSFVLQVKERFHPSLLIRYEPFPTKKTFAQYVPEQVEKMKKELKAFQLIRGPEYQGGQALLLYEWGEGDARFRQTQLYMDRGTHYYLLTTTQLASAPQDHSAALQQMIRTFRPTR